jgi:hypothetical protein
MDWVDLSTESSLTWSIDRVYFHVIYRLSLFLRDLSTESSLTWSIDWVYFHVIYRLSLFSRDLSTESSLTNHHCNLQRFWASQVFITLNLVIWFLAFSHPWLITHKNNKIKSEVIPSTKRQNGSPDIISKCLKRWQHALDSKLYESIDSNSPITFVRETDG